MELQSVNIPGLGNSNELERSPKRQRLSPPEPNVGLLHSASNQPSLDQQATAQHEDSGPPPATSQPVKMEHFQLPGLVNLHANSEALNTEDTTNRDLDGQAEENAEAFDGKATKDWDETEKQEVAGENEPTAEVKQEPQDQEVLSGESTIPHTNSPVTLPIPGLFQDAPSNEDPGNNATGVETSKINATETNGEVQHVSSSESFSNASNGVQTTSAPDIAEGEAVNSFSTSAPTMVNLNPHLDAIEASINDDGAAEWEVDSSPIESSGSSTTSDDTSSGDSDEDENYEEDEDRYALMDPEEQARILMQDGGTDDEGGNKKTGTAGGIGLRTTNEKQEQVVPKPDLVVTPDMKIEELGTVECAVEYTVVIKAKISGDYKVLDAGSLLCLEDRSVIGVVADTLGRTQQPLYTVRFTNDAEIADSGCSETGKTVYYVEQHSKFVFTQPLRGVKGSDASNFHDEEVGDDELEFSDDEKEAEHKRQMKQQRQQTRLDYLGEPADAGKGRRGRRGARRSNFPRKAHRNGRAASGEINYDDVDMDNDDGYTPLQRPTDFQDMIKGREAPVEGYPLPPRPPPSEGLEHSYDRSRGRGDRFHRGSRGRGSNDRGRPRGRGSYHDSRKPPYSHDVKETRPSNMGPPPTIPPTSQSYQNQYGPPQNNWHPTSQLSFPQNQPHHPHSTYDNSQSRQYQPPNAPSLPPQSPGFSPFSPSPISPLPSQQFGTFPFPNQSQQQQHQTFSPHQYLQQVPQMPPPGSHINPAFFNAFRQGHQPPQPQQMPQNGPHGGGVNETAFRQVQDTLEALRRAQGGG